MGAQRRSLESFKEMQGRIVGSVAGAEGFAVNGQQHGFAIVGAEEGVDDGANQHLLTAAVQGNQLIQEGLVQIQMELGAIDSAGIDFHTFLYDTLYLQQKQDALMVEGVHGGATLDKSISCFVWQVQDEICGTEARFRGCLGGCRGRCAAVGFRGMGVGVIMPTGGGGRQESAQTGLGGRRIGTAHQQQAQ